MPKVAPLSLIGLGIATALLSAPNAPLTSADLFWAKDGLVRDLASWCIAVSWLIAADGIVSLVVLAASGVFGAWHEQRRGAVMASVGQSGGPRDGATTMAGFCLSLFVGGLLGTWLGSQFVSLPVATEGLTWGRLQMVCFRLARSDSCP